MWRIAVKREKRKITPKNAVAAEGREKKVEDQNDYTADRGTGG